VVRDRMGARRDSLGWPCAACTSPVQLASSSAGRPVLARFDDHRNCRVHGRAVRDGFAPPRCGAGRWRNPCYRSGRRRGLDRIALLAGLGYEVVASTGRPGEAEYLKLLGATADCGPRSSIVGTGQTFAERALAGVVDAVGSHTLVSACASTRRDGAITACGLAQGGDFPGKRDAFICGCGALRSKIASWLRTIRVKRRGTCSSVTSTRNVLRPGRCRLDWVTSLIMRHKSFPETCVGAQ